MKKIVALLGLAFLIISACLIYLVKSGVGLRSAPIIRPSILLEDGQNMSLGVVARLAPDFQTADYLLLGFLPETADSQKFLEMLKSEYEMLYKKSVQILPNAIEAKPEDIQACIAPCWLLLPNTMANELSNNEWIQKLIRPLNRNYFSITWIPFSTGGEVTDACVQQKRLTLDCLKMLSVHEAKRKMKETEKRYFFMRKYLDRDYFLFVENP